jgi:hypothetical protein
MRALRWHRPRVHPPQPRATAPRHAGDQHRRAGVALGKQTCSHNPMTTPRTVHLVGSLPGHTPRDAMGTAWDILGPCLRHLPDGETGERAGWTSYQAARLEKLPAVYTIPATQRSCWDDKPGHTIRAGQSLTTADVERCLPLRDAFADSYGDFTDLRALTGRRGLTYQLGTPSPLDLAYLMFGPDGPADAGIYGPILEATARHVDDCRHGDVIFQVESTIAPYLTAYADDDAQPKTAADMAARLADLPRCTELGVRYGVHLCTGGQNRRPRTHLPDARPLVLLANEIARTWPAGHLEYLHLPFGAPDLPPSGNPGWYEPLRDLDLPPGVRLIAGFVHEDLDLGQHLRIRDMIDTRLGYPAEISSACGLGGTLAPDPPYMVMGMCREVAAAA